MSLIDPRDAELRKTLDYRGSSAALTATLLFGLGALLAMAVLGFGAGGVLDQVRLVSVNSVFSDWETNIPVVVRDLAIPLGILATILCLGQYNKWNHRYTGRSDHFVILGPLTIALIGLTLGVWTSTMLWVEPDAVGVVLDPKFGEDEPWDAGTWILYTAKWWLPGILAVLTILSLVARFIGLRARKRDAAR
ncbi:hypothetical protein [Microbacterium sp. NPDC057650]|uniref:hypothetical protein n=1 Tax=unclassified Microbacterium TaxID=2609290 RepID=UPI0036731BC0